MGSSNKLKCLSKVKDKNDKVNWYIIMLDYNDSEKSTIMCKHKSILKGWLSSGTKIENLALTSDNRLISSKEVGTISYNNTIYYKVESNNRGLTDSITEATVMLTTPYFCRGIASEIGIKYNDNCKYMQFNKDNTIKLDKKALSIFKTVYENNGVYLLKRLLSDLEYKFLRRNEDDIKDAIEQYIDNNRVSVNSNNKEVTMLSEDLNKTNEITILKESLDVVLKYACKLHIEALSTPYEKEFKELYDKALFIKTWVNKLINSYTFGLNVAIEVPKLLDSNFFGNYEISSNRNTYFLVKYLDSIHKPYYPSRFCYAIQVRAKCLNIGGDDYNKMGITTILIDAEHLAKGLYRGLTAKFYAYTPLEELKHGEYLSNNMKSKTIPFKELKITGKDSDIKKVAKIVKELTNKKLFLA